MVREGRSVSIFSLFSVAEIKVFSDRFSASLWAVYRKLAVAFYLVDGFHRHAVSKTVYDLGGEVAGQAYPKRLVCDYGPKRTAPLSGTRTRPPLYKCSVRRHLPESNSPFLERTITAMSCCRLSMQDRAPRSARDIVTKVDRDTQ